jgi:hypothetical protein
MDFVLPVTSAPGKSSLCPCPKNPSHLSADVCFDCAMVSVQLWALPCSSRIRASGQQHTAHDHDPHEPDEGRDEPRIDAVRRPEPAAQPRGATQQGEHDGCDPRREECIRDQPGPPESERAGHDQHRAWVRTQHDGGPCKVVQPRRDCGISGAGDEYARAAPTVTSRRNNAPRTTLEAVAAEPQPSCPPSAKVLRSAAANHIRLRTAMPA